MSQVEYTYVKLVAKAPRPNRATVGEKPSAFHAFEGSRRIFHITREGDTVTIRSADPDAAYRIVDVPWSQVEYAERPKGAPTLPGQPSVPKAAGR